MNILYLSPYVPSIHANHAGGVCMGKQLEELRKQHNVYVLSFINDEREQELVDKEFNNGECRFVKSSFFSKIGNILLNLNFPFYFSIRKSRKFKNELLDIIQKKKIDAIHAEYTSMGQYYWIKQLYPNIQFDIVEHDVTKQSYDRQVDESKGLKRLFNIWQRNLVVKCEREFCSHADVIFTFNNKDVNLLKDSYGFTNIKEIVPYYGVDFQKKYSYLPNAKSICFVGQMGRPENNEAALRLIELRNKMGRNDIRLNIIGAHPSKELIEKESSNIHITGFVENIEDEIVKNSLAVFPLKSGAGIKLKVLLACGLGIPVITTSVGAEGIDENGDFLQLAETDEQLLQLIKNLIDNEEELTKLSDTSKKFVKDKFDWNKTKVVFDEVYSKESN